MLFAVLLSGCLHHYRGPVVDLHVHVDTPGAPGSVGVDAPADLAAVSDALDALPEGSRAGLVTIAPREDPEQTRIQNDAILGYVGQAPSRYVAVPSVNPWDGDAALTEIDRLADAGARVLKLHPNTQAFDVGDPALEAVVSKAAERGMVLLFDAYSPFDADQTGKFLLLAARNPDARFILAHMGGPKFSEMLLFASAKKFSWYANNIWFELSVTAAQFADSPYEDELVFVCRSVGVDRVLFGSDYPVTTPEASLRAVRALGFTAEEERKILYENATALLGP